MPLSIAILGASGYGGAELLRLLVQNPHFAIAAVTAHSHEGELVETVFPHLTHFNNLRFGGIESSASEIEHCDVVFCALPHGEAMRTLPGLSNPLIVDLGGDFRLKSASDYEEWYGAKHVCPEHLGRWVYGLPELFRDRIKSSRRIASAGCFATAALLATSPLVKHSVVEGDIILNGISGHSGAGRSGKTKNLLSEAYEDVRAYKVGEHQHTPEIELALGLVSSRDISICITTHLAPMSRGILVTASAKLVEGKSLADIEEAFLHSYEGERFITICKDPPGTKDVRGSNFAFLNYKLDKKQNRIIVTCAIDNLVKGAAGQAIQNAQCALGFPEDDGLCSLGLYP